jgi:CRISPR/Cas system CSM-associated protein Csm4 (group 5 of RAMP superfamily)
VAGQIIESYQSLLSVSDNKTNKKSKGVAWQEIKQLLSMQEATADKQSVVENTQSKELENGDVK